MRTVPAGGLVPETVSLTLDDLMADPGAGASAIAEAGRTRRRVVLADVARFGVRPATDIALLRLLSEATGRLTDLDWTLGGVPPWPVRTVVHLLPPAGDTGGDAAEFAGRWREGHRFGLCVYRRGPGFRRVRDVRPGGPHHDVLIEEPWVAVFDGLAAGAITPDDHRSRRLIKELGDAGLVLRLGELHHLLPFRRRKAPTPASGR
ncbi:DUF5825 family protein [Actinoallomurus acaciae]|uniref:DUF5825 family protein n=1 Tax=Actinoallomurus acaciae TaxID=502577 RepID=A0ABV5YV67_9ACTN